MDGQRETTDPIHEDRVKFCPHCHQPLSEQRIKILDHRGYTFVPVRDVIVLRSSTKWVEVWTAQGNQGLISDSLLNLQARYRRWVWLRRGVLADPALIDSVTKLKMKGSHQVTIRGYPEPVIVARRGWRALQIALNAQQQDLPPLPEDRPKRDFPSSRESPSEFWLPSEPASTEF